MKKNYRYVALFSVDGNGTNISFPDLPGCVASAKKNEDVYKQAQTILALYLSGMEQDNEIIPAPSRVKLLAARERLRENEILCAVEVPSLKNVLDDRDDGIVPFTKDDVEKLQNLAVAALPFLVFFMLLIILFFSVAKMFLV